MDCPRCKLSLRENDYEGVKVEMCDTCWGIWLDKGELQEVIDARGMDFSEKERRQFTDLRGGSGARGSTEPAACPRCGQVMEPVHCDLAIHLVVDRCPDHGMWLDTGEIKAVQVMAERSADLHRMLLEKLGLRRG